MTYYRAGPIYVTALSPWLLREHVGWRRWLAVIVGFIGVVIAIQPGQESFSWGALAALTGSFAYACFMVATRKLAATDARVLMGWQLVAALVVGLALLAVQGWNPVRPIDLALMAVLGPRLPPRQFLRQHLAETRPGRRGRALPVLPHHLGRADRLPRLR